MQGSSYKVHILKLRHASIINYIYIIIDIHSKSAMIIDPAWDIKYIITALENLKVRLSGVLITHSHFDHTNLANSLAQKYDVDVYMSSREIQYYKFKCLNLKPLDDEEKIYLGNTTIKAILTPGHTAGSVCFYVEGCLFTGDCIFIEGCGICSPEGASAEDMYNSIQKVKKIVPVSTKIYPGHCYGTKVGRELSYLYKNNIYFNINRLDQFVDFRMREGQTGLFDFK